ncbi:sensor histidine kinase [Spirillospora sp. NBC_01491]|uniref:sensor histidine kinase n=1 Tax=Spirillospora sp. NBC_01491 TaxID=2976007 RepID=UPI002E37671F|nr:HAMP domain-containing sensor histidine kinase [Spirillospora sp. NBC_01491]
MATTRAGRAGRWFRHWRSRLLYSIRGRATVVTVVVSALILDVCLALAGMLAQDAAENVVADRVEKTVERIGYDIARTDATVPIVPREDEANLVQIVRNDQTVLAASADAQGLPALAAPSLNRNQLLIDRKTCPAFLDDCAWVFGLRMPDSPYGPQVMLYAAEPLPTLAGTWPVTLWALLILALLLGLIGWWTWRTVGRTLAPVEAIRAEMAGISAAGLGRRVPVPDTGGEIQHLAETVNDTLERLEEATGRERRFVSDASHDLRNPIAGLHTRLEVALDEPEGYDWRAMTREALRDTERLNDIVADLLELSRLDSRAPAPMERVDLAALARREIDRRPAAVPITPRLGEGAVVEANPVRLARVLGNLLGNAERHAESGIGVAVGVEEGEAVLEVVDDGAGVPEEARERVFERFARLPESRRRDPAGTGLGLPIAREIAEIYGGTLRIADSPVGARFVLRLPLAPPGATLVR